MSDNKVTICGHEYRIVEIMQEEAQASVRYTACEIAIEPRQADSQKEESLIHEVIHAILFHHTGNVEHDEVAVQAIASGLFQMGVRIPSA